MRSQAARARRRLWTFTLSIPPLSAALIVALWHWRPVLEPVTRLAAEALLHRRRHGHADVLPDHYWIYTAVVAVAGLILLALGVLALRDAPASARRLDDYLDSRNGPRAPD